MSHLIHKLLLMGHESPRREDEEIMVMETGEIVSSSGLS